jgi:hypothetical protein
MKLEINERGGAATLRKKVTREMRSFLTKLAENILRHAKIGVIVRSRYIETKL